MTCRVILAKSEAVRWATISVTTSVTICGDKHVTARRSSGNIVHALKSSLKTAIGTSASLIGKTSEREPSRGALTLSLGTMLAIWSGNYVAGKLALRHIDPLSMASLRIELAALVMLAIYFSRRRAPLRRRDLPTFFVLGLFGVAINQGCFTIGLNYTTSSHAVILIALDPMIVLLLASALKLEAFTTAKFIGMVISFTGVVLLETDRSVAETSFHMGDLLTLGCVMGYSIYAVLGKRAASRAVGEHYDAVAVNTFMTVAAAILFAPVAIRQGIALDWRSVGWVGWTGLVYMAVLASVVSYTLFNWLLRHMDASRIASLNYIQVPIVIVMAVWILGERPSGHLLSGAALVLAGVYLAERHAKLFPVTPGG
jgi:drug/metabolite transporter (DMT)-like permease